MKSNCAFAPLVSMPLVSHRRARNQVATLLLLVPLLAALAAHSQTSESTPPSAAGPAVAAPGLYVKVQFPTEIKTSKLKPGDAIDGSLSRDVYSGDHKVFSSGDRVRLTVDHLERRKRARTDHWPGVVTLFTPRHENYPVFKSATVTDQDKEHALQVSMIASRHIREVQAQTRQASQTGKKQGAVVTGTSNKKQKPPYSIVLEASETNASDSPAPMPEPTADHGLNETLPIGTRFKVVLLGDVSASKNKPGDMIQARLLEPVLLNTAVALPAGSLLEGKVVKTKAPRMLSRAGSLYLTFVSVTVPSGNRAQLAASLAGAELDERSHTKMDAEGELHGEHPGKAWMAINLGVTAGFAKVGDDTLQLIIESIVSTATDTSTAGVGRIAAAGASGIYLATRKGRDVVLPRFTEMEISLDRPLSLDAGHAAPVAPASTGAAQ